MNPDRLPLMNEHAAAQRLNVTVPTLRNWRYLRKGPTFKKIGGSVKYDPRDLDEFIEKSTIEVAA